MTDPPTTDPLSAFLERAVARLAERQRDHQGAANRQWGDRKTMLLALVGYDSAIAEHARRIITRHAPDRVLEYAPTCRWCSQECDEISHDVDSPCPDVLDVAELLHQLLPAVPGYPERA